MKKIIHIVLICNASILFSQNINFDQIGTAKLINVSGGLSANSVFYSGDADRDALTYFVNGTINMNISGLYNIPLSFSYSNQDFSYNQPFKFNRLSLHPSYKWVAAHIGDVAMNFSPYTLGGFQFTGVGVDLAPSGPFKISGMYGRFLKPVEFDPAVQETVPSYRRTGYGFKASYDFQKTKVGIILFKAKDDLSSVDTPIPLETGVTPKENLVLSLNTSTKVFDKATIRAEYAISGLTNDIRTARSSEGKTFLSTIFDHRESTSYYNAVNADFIYALGKGNVGVGYERIDPNYSTLGAYYFNNDIENITVKGNQSIFKDKVTVGFNAGLQRDNLDKNKKSEMQRIVSAINVNYNASQKLQVMASYSNFQSFTNLRNQFDFINQVSDFENIDTLNFSQLSQNAVLGINYELSKSKKKIQRINVNFNFQDTQDKQTNDFTGISAIVGDTKFYNAATAYSITFPENSLGLSANFNGTYNTFEDDEAFTFGPTISVNKQFLDKKLRTAFSSSYNESYTNNEFQNSTINFRLNGNYQLLKSHQFNLSAISQFRNNNNQRSNDFTVTFGYNYTFNPSFKKKTKEKIDKTNQDKDKNASYFKIRYRGYIYAGTPEEIVRLANEVNQEHEQYKIPDFKKEELQRIEDDIVLLKEAEKEIIKDKILDYLDGIYHYKDFVNAYEELLYDVFLEFRADAHRLDYGIEKNFVKAKLAVDTHEFKDVEIDDSKKDSKEFQEYVSLQEEFKNKRRKFVAHRWTLDELKMIKSFKSFMNERQILSQFRKANFSEIYQKHLASVSPNGVNKYITEKYIEFYHEIAFEKANQEFYILKYIYKSE